MTEPNKLLMLTGIIFIALGSCVVMKERAKTGVFLIILGYFLLEHFLIYSLWLHFKL